MLRAVESGTWNFQTEDLTVIRLTAVGESGTCRGFGFPCSSLKVKDGLGFSTSCGTAVCFSLDISTGAC